MPNIEQLLAIRFTMVPGGQSFCLQRKFLILLLSVDVLLFLLKDASSFLTPSTEQKQHELYRKRLSRSNLAFYDPFGVSLMNNKKDESISFIPIKDSHAIEVIEAKKIDSYTSSIDGIVPSNFLCVHRRDLIKRPMTMMLMAAVGMEMAHAIQPVSADDSVAGFFANPRIGSTADHPIVVIGAGGKTGLLCVAILSQQYGRHVRCVTRSGRTVPIPKLNPSNDAYESQENTLSPSSNPLVTFVAGDVTQYNDMVDAVRGASGVIFAASASAQQGSDPAHVDFLGLYYTARACLTQRLNVRLVVISAGSITRPDALGYKATNAMVELRYGPQMMEYKLAGEDAVRNLFEESINDKQNEAKSVSGDVASYVIIRPGGLRDGPAVGAQNMHISQGDVFTSEVSRLDVAHVTVGALLHPSDTIDFCTLEVNQKQGLTKVMPSLPDLPKVLVHTTTPTSGTSAIRRGSSSSSYFALLYGLLNDAELQNRYPEILNTNNLDNSRILSLKSLIG